MARFDAYTHSGRGYLLDCQADILGHFDTRFVVPLLPAKNALKASRLHPVFTIDEEPHIMVTHLAATVPVRDLKQKAASLSDEHDTIINALDMLLTGY